MINHNVAIIIVNYQSYNDTIEYVNDLNEQKNINLLILLVDNCSTNDSFKILKKKYSSSENIIVIRSEKNGGYAYGNNYGLNFLKNRPLDYIIISNNDIRISDTCLIFKLITEYSKCDKIAFASPIMQVNGIEAKYPAWKLPTIKDDLKDSLFIFKLLMNQNISYDFSKNNFENMEVDCLPGSFFIGKKEIFYEIGMFDENTFLFAEERILSWKVKQAGYKNYLIRSLEYNHLESGSISYSVKRIKMQRYLVESRKYYHKTYTKSKLVYIILLEVLYIVWKIEALIYYKMIKKK